MTSIDPADRGGPPVPTVMTIFGTRPEAIKLAPVLRALDRNPRRYRSVAVATSQHTGLLRDVVDGFGLRIDHDLRVMRPGQSLNRLCARIVAALDPLIDRIRPDLVLVQGDTTTALAGALAAFHRGVPVGHVEAGLRSGNLLSPFPEEANRQLITRLTRWHFAATPHNVAALLAEGVPEPHIHLTGNPVVDSLHWVLANRQPGPAVTALLSQLAGRRLVVLTTHRRESFGETMGGNLAVLRAFIARHPDTALVFPVHPNPRVRQAAADRLAGTPRVCLIDPLGYADFIHLLSRAWLIISDSGGIQEEAPSLGKPLLILRENTERPEAVQCGVARLVGGAPERLSRLLAEIEAGDDWPRQVAATANPYGRGDSARRIVAALDEILLPADLRLPEAATPLDLPVRGVA